MSGRISQQRRAMDIGYLRDGISSTFSNGRNGPAYTEEENVELDGIPWYQYRAPICQILPIRQSFLPTAPPTCDRSSFTSRRELFSSDDMPNKLNSVESRFVQPSFSIKHLDSLSILPPDLHRISLTDRSWVLDSYFWGFHYKSYSAAKLLRRYWSFCLPHSESGWMDRQDNANSRSFWMSTYSTMKSDLTESSLLIKKINHCVCSMKIIIPSLD